MKKQTFDIPSGCTKVTVEQVGNTIVTTFESEKYIPKVGDCVKITTVNNNVIYTDITNVDGNYIGYYIRIYNGEVCGVLDEIKELHFNQLLYCNKITPEELQAEFNKLGYEYDFETHEAKKIRWKPELYQDYYYVNSNGAINCFVWHNSIFDNDLFEICNCYKTPEKAEPRRQHYLNFKD